MTIKELEAQRQLKNKKPKVYEKVIKYPDKEARGESVAIIQMQYSYLCNMRCNHCCIQKFRDNPNNANKKKLDISEVKRIADEADSIGLAHWVITGGEPLAFHDLEDVINAIGKDRFHIALDTNGYLLDLNKAKWLKSMGIDRLQLSLDSFDQSQDILRNKKGSQSKAESALYDCLDAGLNTMIATVVDKKRLHSDEFIYFLNFAKNLKVPVFVTFYKPVGFAEGRYEVMTDRKDVEYLNELKENYNVFCHMTPAYGRSGCIAINRMVSLTQFGDIMVCPYGHISLGNIFNEPLKDILDRGMKQYKYYMTSDICPIAQDKRWVKKYLEKKVWGKELPVKAEEVFDEI